MPLTGEGRCYGVDPILVPEEEERLQRILSPGRRARVRAAWSARRAILGQVLGCKPHEVRLRQRRGTAPTVEAPGGRGLNASLSHSADWMAFAVSETRAIGVDIEFVDPGVDTVRLAWRFFRPEEAGRLASLSDDEHSLAFFRAWSHKEALLKAMGGGVPSRLRSLPAGSGASLERAAVNSATWLVRDLGAPASYVAALAARGPEEGPIRVHWTLSLACGLGGAP